jgi:urea transporter
MMMEIIDFLKIILRGISQVMFQNNPITGLLFLIGIFYNSWIMGIGVLVGVFTSTITAFILNYKKKDIHDGLYGFNGTLVGAALLFFFEINILLIFLVILGSILSSVIMNYMHNKKLSPYTFPFVLSTWILIILIKYFDLIPQQTQELVKATNLNIMSSLSMGFGQVMFQVSIITGVIFFIAILINSRISAVYAFIGSLIGMLLALGLSFPLNLVNIGIFGFNGVLCGIAFADNKKSSLFYAAISIVISVFIIYGMITFDLVALTAPFVFATWITLALRKSLNQKMVLRQK